MCYLSLNWLKSFIENNWCWRKPWGGKINFLIGTLECERHIVFPNHIQTVASCFQTFWTGSGPDGFARQINRTKKKHPIWCARLRIFASGRFAEAKSWHPIAPAKKLFRLYSHRGQQSRVIQGGDSVTDESRLICTWSPRHKPLSGRLPGRSYAWRMIWHFASLPSEWGKSHISATGSLEK